MMTFADVIDRWDSAEAFAADIGVSGTHARQMKRRDNIPANHWRKVVDAAISRGFMDITEKFLTDLAAQDLDKAS